MKVMILLYKLVPQIYLFFANSYVSNKKSVGPNYREKIRRTQHNARDLGYTHNSTNGDKKVYEKSISRVNAASSTQTSTKKRKQVQNNKIEQKIKK